MNHLLQIAIGPVQEFIAAARRTRDLWFGSYLLSEISKAAALSVLVIFVAWACVRWFKRLRRMLQNRRREQQAGRRYW